MANFYFCFFILILFARSLTPTTIDTSIYPNNGGTPTVLFDQGKIYEIEWEIAGCVAVVEAIKLLKWNGGTGTEGCASSTGFTKCTTVNLAADEYINAYRVQWEQAPVAIWFRSNKGTEYKCGPTWPIDGDSGWIEHTNYYLSGFKYEAGWIVDRIGFQFTATVPESTNIPTSTPTKYPTSNPSKNPTQSPTFYPTLHPTTNNPTTSPTIQPSKVPTFMPSVSPTKYPSKYPTKSPLITQHPTNNPSKYPTKSQGGEGGVNDEISSTYTYINHALDIGAGKNGINSLMITIICCVVFIFLCLIIIALFIWRKKSKKNKNENKDANANTTEFQNVASVSSVTTPVSDNNDLFTTMDGVSATAPGTQMVPIPNNPNRNAHVGIQLPPKVIPMVNTDYGQRTEGIDTTNTKYSNVFGEGNEVDNIENMDNINGDEEIINETVGGQIDYIVNEINKTKDMEDNQDTEYDNYNNVCMDDEYEYYYEDEDIDVLQQVNSTCGNENNVLNDEFEVIDDSINALQAGDVNPTPGDEEFEITTAGAYYN